MSNRQVTNQQIMTSKPVGAFIIVLAVSMIVVIGAGFIALAHGAATAAGVLSSIGAVLGATLIRL